MSLDDLRICTECGKPFRGSTQECPRCVTITLSGVDGTMDRLVEEASVPNLGALIRGAKKKGLIKPVKDYASN